MNKTRRHRQRGYFTLLISLVLISASTLAIRGLARSGVTELRISNNEQMHLDASHAAEAAWDYGLAWYAENEPTWATVGSVEQGTMPAPRSVTAGNGETYAGSVTFTRDPALQDYLLITATATAATNIHVSATVRQYIHNNLLLTEGDFDYAPVTIDGCLGGVTGNPDIYPNSGADYDGSAGIAIRTSEPADCLIQGHLNYHGGTEEHSAFTGDIWDQFFKLSRTEMQAIANQEVAAGVPDSQRKVVWETSTSNYHTSWGSPTNPVILIFAPSADCPKINGSPTHYGLIFVDSDCGSSQGWGGTEVYGGVAINGGVTKFTANTEIYGWSGAGSGGDPYNLKADWVSRIPGSWRDF